ncbi:MAG TPA: DedA family protein [Stellaceae bacterium]|nr:DedA family protein [Stellaceae bacterium]
MDWPFHGDISHFIAHYGYWAVAVVIALESIGLPLPGEATLIAAALYAGSTHETNIALVIVAGFAGAVIGASVGFWIGEEAGFRLLVRYGNRLGLTERRIKLGRYLFWHHGGKVVFFGRFVPILRALASLLAGVNRMERSRFIIFNVAGAAAWSALYGLAAYGMGEEIKRLSGPIGIASGAIALILIVTGAMLIRRHEERLANEAERQFPGPIKARRR